MPSREQTLTAWKRTFPQRPREPHPLGRNPDLWMEDPTPWPVGWWVAAFAVLGLAVWGALAWWWL